MIVAHVGFTDATRHERPDLIDRVIKTLLHNDPAVHAAMWDMICTPDLVDQLRQIKCAALGLVGQFDPSSPPAAAQVLVDNLFDARKHVVADASHMSLLERPEVVKRYLHIFLAEQASGSEKANS